MKIFTGTDPQHRVADAGDHAVRVGLLHDAARPAEQALGGAHGQAAEPLGRAVGDDLPVARPHADAGIHDAGDAVGQAGPARIVDRLHQFRVRRLRQHGLEPVAAGLGQKAGQPPVPLLDGAALGHGRRLVDAREPEGQRVADVDVPAGPDDVDRMVGRRRVEFLAETDGASRRGRTDRSRAPGSTRPAASRRRARATRRAGRRGSARTPSARPHGS